MRGESNIRFVCIGEDKDGKEDKRKNSAHITEGPHFTRLFCNCLKVVGCFFKLVCVSYQFKDYAVNGQAETCKDIVCTLQRKFPGKTSEWRFCSIM